MIFHEWLDCLLYIDIIHNEWETSSPAEAQCLVRLITEATSKKPVQARKLVLGGTKNRKLILAYKT